MRLLITLSSLVLPALLIAAPVPKEDKKLKDEEAILGTWKVEKFEMPGGGGPSPDEINKIRFVFEKDGKMKMTGGPGGEEVSTTYKLDPSAKPKTIDMTMTHPGQKPNTALGIYELDGDTLKLCVAEGSAKNRPEELKADGNRFAVVTFTRVKE